MKIPNRYVLAAVLGGGILTILQPTEVHAEKLPIKSSGVVQFINPANEEVYLDSADLVYLQNEIDELQKLYEPKLVTAYNNGYSDGQAKKSGPTVKHQYHVHVDANGKSYANGTTLYATSNPGGCFVGAGHTHNACGACPYHTVYHPEEGHDETYICSWRATGNVENAGMLGVCPYHPTESYTWEHWGGYSAACGHTETTYVVDSPAWTETIYDCGSPTNTWRLGCGKSTSTIINTTLTFYPE